MHIPDNYLSPSTCAVFGAAIIPVWTKCTKEVKKEISKKKMPLLGISAAFSFLIMMFNLPLPGGTTGHAVGAAIIAIIMGPYAACISVSMALLVQALFFGDGGILAYGANCFNMAFIMPFTAYYIYKLIKGKSTDSKRDYTAAFISGYLSLNIAALFAATEFGIQPLLFKDGSGMPIYCPYPPSVSIPSMLIPHLLVAGVAEGIITASVYSFVKKTLHETGYNNEKIKVKPFYTLLIILAVISPLGLLAKGTAWGEWGADEIKETAGFIPHAMEKGFNFNSIMPDYSISGVGNVLGYIISAVIGIAIIILIFKLLSKSSASKNK